jgi:hypothetical protein
LNRYVPALSLDFQGRAEEELAEISNLYFIKVVINSSVLSSVIQGWIVSKSRGFHADHSKAPGRYVLELGAKDN